MYGTMFSFFSFLYIVFYFEKTVKKKIKGRVLSHHCLVYDAIQPMNRLLRRKYQYVDLSWCIPYMSKCLKFHYQDTVSNLAKVIFILVN
jgi:hypothetical protein